MYQALFPFVENFKTGKEFDISFENDEKPEYFKKRLEELLTGNVIGFHQIKLPFRDDISLLNVKPLNEIEVSVEHLSAAEKLIKGMQLNDENLNTKMIDFQSLNNPVSTAFKNLLFSEIVGGPSTEKSKIDGLFIFETFIFLKKISNFFLLQRKSTF